MIHKLYVNIAGWSKLDIDKDKKVILDTMKFDNKKMKHTRYMLVDEDDRIPSIIPPQCITLNSQEEIDNYLKAYEERQRLESMSVLDLKREIVKNQIIKNP